MNYQYKVHHGKLPMQYIAWWEPNFPVSVFVEDPRPLLNREIFDWFKANYPHLSGDTYVRQEAQPDKSWYEYDWGYHREGIYSIFYFKDRKVAAHFKLAWG